MFDVKIQIIRKLTIQNSAAVGITSHLNGSASTGHYRLGSNYGMRNPGGSNFTSNPRLKKPVNSSTGVHNTMASFRSGPVKVVVESKNSANANSNYNTSKSNIK